MPKGVYIRTEECRRIHSLARIGRQHTEEHNRNIGKSLLGKRKGIAQSEESNEKRRKTWQSKMECGFVRAYKGIPFSEEHRRNKSLSMKEWWSDPSNKTIIEERNKKIGLTTAEIWGRLAVEDRECRIMNAIKGLLQRPTSFERRVIFLIERYAFPFKYIGDGREIVGHVNPDFKDTLNSTPPMIIEVFYSFFKKERYRLVRHKQLSIPVENVLFLDENDLEAQDWEDRCSKKITDFCDRFIIVEKGGN